MESDFKKRVGQYVTQSTMNEPFQAYIPPKLPPDPPLNLENLYPLLEKTTQALAELNTGIKYIPNISLFIYVYVRKEALLSSQIEGTQSSFSDLMLFEHHQETTVSLDDVEEVSNYVMAVQYGIKRLQEGFPLSLRLLREIHEVLLRGTRGSQKSPGEFRRTQNWIGGSRPGNAMFVPPPPDQLMNCLSDFEKFLHDETLPVLIKAGLAHVQFETIHPFLDGNGRLGRLLIILLLCDHKMLHEPILYLSLFFKKNRTTYYHLLQEVRMHGTWEIWLEFFLQGIMNTSKQALATAERINQLFFDDNLKLQTLGRHQASCIDVFNYLKKLPQVSVPLLSDELKIAGPTARSAIEQLCEVGILEQLGNKKRDKIYIYKKYLEILEEDAEPFSE